MSQRRAKKRVNKRRMSKEQFEAACVAGEFGGQAIHVTVLHDDGCSPAMCRCSPEYIVEELTVSSALAGHEAQQRWIKETSN